jgi:hypothetical protein
MLINFKFASIFMTTIDEIWKASRIFLNAAFCSFSSLFRNYFEIVFDFFIKFLNRNSKLHFCMSYIAVDLSSMIILTQCFADDWLRIKLLLRLQFLYSLVLWMWVSYQCKFWINWRFFEFKRFFVRLNDCIRWHLFFEFKMNHFWLWIVTFDYIFTCSFKCLWHRLTHSFSIDFDFFWWRICDNIVYKTRFCNIYVDF